MTAALRLLRWAAVLAAREALLVLLCFGAWAVLPAAAGFQTTTVMSDSMAPGIRAGDVVVSRAVTTDQLGTPQIGVGRVLLVDDPDHPGRLRLHRWVGVRGGMLILRGDANAHDDSSPVARDRVRGAGFLRVPFVGLPALWIRNAQWAPLVAAGAAVLLAGVVAAPRGPRILLGAGGGRPAAAACAVVLAGSAVVGGSVVGGAVVPASSWAAFSRTTSNGTDKFSTSTYDCFAKTYPNVPPASLRYSYSLGSGTTEPDQSGSGRDGRITTTAMRASATCSGNPYITTSTSSTYVYQSTAVTSPAQFGVSAWFRTGTAGGKIAGFGNAGSGNSTTYDRHVYMSNSGLLTFGVQTDAGRTTCTTSGAFADSQWHLVVATYSAGTLTLWTDNGQAGCTATASGTIQSYTGYWQFGNDTLSTSLWPNASTSSYFRGDLDETAVYDSPLTISDERAIWAAGR